MKSAREKRARSMLTPRLSSRRLSNSMSAGGLIACPATSSPMARGHQSNRERQQPAYQRAVA
ncbi:hypothetical protein D3C86_1952690 [compost metagenome]